MVEKSEHAESLRVAVAVISAMTDQDGHFVQEGIPMSASVRQSFVDEYGSEYVLDSLQNLAYLVTGNLAEVLQAPPREVLRRISQVVTELEGE